MPKRNSEGGRRSSALAFGISLPPPPSLPQLDFGHAQAVVACGLCSEQSTAAMVGGVLSPFDEPSHMVLNLHMMQSGTVRGNGSGRKRANDNLESRSNCGGERRVCRLDFGLEGVAVKDGLCNVELDWQCSLDFRVAGPVGESEGGLPD